MAELFDRRLKARSLAYMFTAGAALGLATLAFPHDEGVKDTQLIALAVIAFAIASVFYTQADRVAEWQLHVALAAGALILTFAKHHTGPPAPFPLLFSWGGVVA